MQDAGKKYARWIDVERLGREPIVFDIVVSGEENSDLVKRLGIVEMQGLEASGSLRRKSGKGLVECIGTVKADITQSCVVSLEPVTQKIEENFTVCYTFDIEDIKIEDEEYVVSLKEEDLPELIEDGKIDVIQAIVEQISLALDPYPRAEDVENTKVVSALRDVEKSAKDSEQEVHRPFANLRDLMNKK